jgi:sialidase-1
MRQRVIVFFVAFVLCFQAVAQSLSIPVFTSGSQGYKSFRIPAIVKTPAETLVAFAEGRVNSADDFGNIDLVVKRSLDQGATWSSMNVVVDCKNLQAGNPAPVVDLTDPRFPKGRIFLFYNTGNNSENEVRKGNGCREVWYKTSIDEGVTWSEPTNITLQVHHPKQPKFNPAYNCQEDWRSYANTPGHAMQFERSRYKARIYVAANHSQGDISSSNTDYFSHGFYTDDHGATFKLAQSVPLAGSNESTAAELSNGSLLLNCRNQKGDVQNRIIALSHDGGEKWDKAYFDSNLPDPICQGAILTVGFVKGKATLAFVNNADRKDRNNLTLRLSADEGATWPESYLIDKNPVPNDADYTAYADLVKLDKRKIGVLYEKADYSLIVFKSVNLK